MPSKREVIVESRSGGVPELPMDVDENGFPLIHKFSARIGDLEHRLDYLERNFDPGRAGPGKTRIVGEIWALKAALVVMRYHELEVGGELSVVTALERLVHALRAHFGDVMPAGDDGNELDDAYQQARTVLEELGVRP